MAIQNANSTFLVSEEPTRSREVVLTYMNWLYLFIAGLFEIAWAIGLKYTEGWTGIGTVGAAILGVILFDEPRDMLRVGCIFLIIAGIAGLKLTSS